MTRLLLLLFLWLASFYLSAQDDSQPIKKRLDFAKTYFELGTNISPSFQGKVLQSNQITNLEHSVSANPYLNWGGFHFWGHAEFYVSFPLHQLNFKESDIAGFELKHYVVTGARFLPWAMEPKKLRPYLGLSWSSQSFQQTLKPANVEPIKNKDFLLVPDVGLFYGLNNFGLRLGVNYFHQNEWQYPITLTNSEIIKTPKFNVQLGINYSF